MSCSDLVRALYSDSDAVNDALRELALTFLDDDKNNSPGLCSLHTGDPSLQFMIGCGLLKHRLLSTSA